MPFRPQVNDQLTINSTAYSVAEHPAAPGVPYGQAGRRAIVYQVLAGEEQRALKVFSRRFRTPAQVLTAQDLAPYASLEGLQVCERTVVTPERNGNLLKEHPDLAYAVLMPWIDGATWMETMVQKRDLTPEKSLDLARSLAGILANMEERGLAHCDLSGPNVMLPPEGGVALVDVEEMYGPEFERPDALPSGTAGYGHRTVDEGVWGAEADQFAGAVLLVEMLGWCDERVREAAWGEQYFSKDEIQEEVERYHVLVRVLRERWGEEAAAFLERAWYSETLDDAPSFQDWLATLPKEIPVIAKGSMAASEDERIEKQEAANKETPQALVDLGKSLAEQGNLAGALEAYRRAQATTPPDSEIAEQLAVLIQSLEAEQEEASASALERSGEDAVAKELVTPARRSALEAELVLIEQEPDQEEPIFPGLELPAKDRGKPQVRTPDSMPSEVAADASSPTPPWYQQIPGWAWGLVVIAGVMIVAALSRVSRDTPAGTVAPTATRHPPTATAYLTTVTPTPTKVLIGTSTPQPVVAFSPDSTTRMMPLEDLRRAPVNEVIYSPDGELMAVASSIGIYVYNAESLNLVVFIEYDSSALTIAFSPDGRTLASGFQNGTVGLWRVSDGALLRQFEGHTSAVLSIDFSPDGEVLASGSSDRTIRLWRVSDGTLLHTFEGHEDGIRSVVLSPDGESLASGSQDATVRLWRVSDGTLLHTFEGHTLWVSTVAFSPDGETLASGSYDNTVRLWRVSDGTLLHTLEEHRHSVTAVTFSPNGGALASGSWDRKVRVWRASDGTLLHTLEGHLDSVSSVAFSSNGEALASGSHDNTVRLWRVSDGSQLRLLDIDADVARNVAFSPNGRILASGSHDNMVRLWEVYGGALLRTLEGHTAVVWSVAFSPDGERLVSGSDDGTVRLWRVSDGSLLHTMEGHTRLVRSVAFSSDGEVLASGSKDNTVRLWRVSDGTLLQTLEGHTATVESVDFSPDGEILASGSEEWTVRLWRVSDGTLLRTLEGHTGAVESVVFSNDGKILASGARDGTVRLWEVSGGSWLRTLEGDADSMRCVDFSPGGGALASGSQDGTVWLWRVSDGAPLRTLEGHLDAVLGIAFSSDGRILVSGARDGTVQVMGTP